MYDSDETEYISGGDYSGNLQPESKVEAALLLPAPRRVQFNESSGKLNPWALQAFVILPALGVLFFCLLMTIAQHAFLPVSLLVLLAVLLMGNWIWAAPIYHQWLVSNGQPALATITRKEFISRSSYRDDYRSPNRDSYKTLHQGDFVLHYEFSTADGRRIESKMQVDKEFSETVTRDDQVTILYDPKNPHDSILYKCSLYVPQRAKNSD